MDFAKFLELAFFPSNVVLIVFLIFIYSSFSTMSFIDLFVYGLAVVGFPVSFFIMNKKTRRKDRTALIAIVLTILIFTYLSLTFDSLRNLRYLYLTTYSFLTLGLLVFIIRLKWKISLHVSVLTASITLLSLFNNNFIVLYLLIPLVAWSRIKLKVHTFYQVLAGFLIGLFVSLVFFL